MFTGVLETLALGVLAALTEGRAGRDEWVSAVTKLLGAILGEQDETLQTLNRIETKIDRLVVQPYKAAMFSGFQVLTDAQTAWRSTEERKALISEARTFFVQASGTAPDLATRAMAEVMSGLCWLAMPSLPDCSRALGRAHANVLDGYLDVIDMWSRPPTGRVDEIVAHKPLLDRLRYKLSGVEQERQREEAIDSLRWEAAEEGTFHIDMHNSIQVLRAALGAPSSDCTLINGAQLYKPGVPTTSSSALEPRIFVPLVDHRRFLGAGVTLLKYQVSALKDFEGLVRPPWDTFDAASCTKVDAHLRIEVGRGPLENYNNFTFMAWANSARCIDYVEPLISKPLKELADAVLNNPEGRYDGYATLLPEPMLTSRPLKYLESFSLPLGTTSEGWIETVCEGKPEVLEIQVSTNRNLRLSFVFPIHIRRHTSTLTRALVGG